MSAAVLGGVVTGAGLGAAQWALLRRRGVGVSWIPATAAGLGVGLAVGAALVSYRTDITSLVVMGAVSGLGVGIAQGAMLGNTKRMLGWAVATAALWAVGWATTTAGGISVDEQFVVFGAYGAIASTFLQSIIIGWFVPAKAVAVMTAGTHVVFGTGPAGRAVAAALIDQGDPSSHGQPQRQPGDRRSRNHRR